MSETWGEMRAEISAQFAGHVPYDEASERLCMEAWQRNPARVASEVQRLAGAQASGQVRFPWSVLAKMAPSIGAEVDRGAVADPTAARSKAVRCFDSWLRNAGIHYDRWVEVADEIFGERGMLRHWRDDDALIGYVKHSWEEHKHIGAEVEREALERAASYRKAKEAVK